MDKDYEKFFDALQSIIRAYIEVKTSEEVKNGYKMDTSKVGLVSMLLIQNAANLIASSFVDSHFYEWEQGKDHALKFFSEILDSRIKDVKLKIGIERN